MDNIFILNQAGQRNLFKIAWTLIAIISRDPKLISDEKISQNRLNNQPDKYKVPNVMVGDP